MSKTSFPTYHTTPFLTPLLDVVITASLDKTIKVFDLEMLRPIRTLVGHTSGVRCLTYDFHGNLYSAGFEHDIYVWDLEAGLSYPLNKLVKGHSDPIVKIGAPYLSGRLCSLDTSGHFSWWDIRRNVALENHERCIQSFDCPPHLCQTFDVAHSVENALEFSTNGMTLVAGSKKIHAFDSVDVRPPEAPQQLALSIPWVTISSPSMTRISRSGILILEGFRGRFQTCLRLR